MAEPITNTLDPQKGLLDNLDAIHREAFPVIDKLPPTPAPPKDPPVAPPPVDGAEEDLDKETDDVPEPVTPKPSPLDWKKAKEARKTARQKYESEIKALRSDLEKAKSSAPAFDPNEYESLKKSKSELEKELQAVAIERSPEFQNRFKIESDTILEVAKQNVSPAHAGKLDSILALPPGRARTAELDALVSDLSPSEVALVNASILDMDKLNHKKRVIVEKQRDQWVKEQSERNSQAKQQADQERQKFSQQFDETVKGAREHFEIYTHRENDQKWNDRVEEQVKLADKIFRGEGMKPDELARASLWAAAAPALLDDYKGLVQEHNKLKKELADIRGSTPSMNGGGSPAKETAPDKNMSAVDYMVQQVERAGLVR